jgi:aspartate aminotransferase/aminotransferase
MIHYKFAARIEKVEVSGVRRIFDLVQSMPEAIDLSLGQAHFDVPEAIKQAAFDAIERGFNRYTVTQGIPELHQKLRQKLELKYGQGIDSIIITCGCSGGLFLALMVLVDRGDEVLIPDPHFVLYRHLVNVCDGIPIFIDTYPDLRIKPDRLKRLITPRTKILIFNNPVNPTGVAYTAQEVQEIARIAMQHGILILSDEIYDHFIYDFPHESMMRYQDPEGLILVSGFSKTYGMPGWRLGYAIGPHQIIEKMAMLQQFTFVCAPAPLQRAVISALDYDMQDQIGQYRKKRDMVYEGLKGNFEVVLPQGAFYIFPKVPWGTDKEFVEAAIKNNVLIVPGSAFSQRGTHFRLSFAATDEAIEKGVDILNRLAKGR